MYYKRYLFCGIDMKIYCTPETTSRELAKVAEYLFVEYMNGKLTYKELTGEKVDGKK